jgi:hypothetical protein
MGKCTVQEADIETLALTEEYASISLDEADLEVPTTYKNNHQSTIYVNRFEAPAS